MGDQDSDPRQPIGGMPAPDRPSEPRTPRASTRVGRYRTHVARGGKKLPWSDKTVILVGLLLVLLFSPVWLDPMALGEPAGSDGQTAPLTPARTPGGRPLPTFGPPIAEGPVTVVVRDTFDRTVVDGWERAEPGGVYALRGPAADFAVALGSAAIDLATANVERAVYLPRISVRNVDLTFSAQVDRLPVGGNVFVYGLVRRTNNGLAYRPKIIIAETGAIFAHAGVMRVDGEQSMGSPVLIPDLAYEAGALIRVRATASGSDPTTLRIRAWMVGDREPDFWHFSVVDWTGRLQEPGAVGVAAYLGSRVTNAPAVVRVHDILATTTDMTNTSSAQEPPGDN